MPADGKEGPSTHRWPEWWKGTVRRLEAYVPPIRDRRFWTIQGLVLLIAASHLSLEVLSKLGYRVVVGSSPQVVLLSFVPVSLFFIPVVYAALNYGFRGAVATALWCTALTAPNVVLHSGMERVREAWQVGLVDAVAIFLGQRIEREIAARKRAEAASLALKTSEANFRGLFESSAVAILVLDPAGRVLDANDAAGQLFKKSSGSLNGSGLSELLGREGADKLLSCVPNGTWRDGYIVLKDSNATEVYLEPALTSIGVQEGETVVQVLLRDVTEEQLRQAGLRTYASNIIRAQEEERKRIAQEVHDEIVQALILLCRRLDAIQGGTTELPASADDGLTAARRSAEELISQLRVFAGALRPPMLEDLGLVASVRRLLVEVNERAGIHTELKVAGSETRLTPEVELGAFRIVQEATRNVERHARARNIRVTIAYHSGESRFEVEDDGAGFLLQAVPGRFSPRSQLGILGMRERAQLLGGRLEIQSKLGAGTRVTLSLPTAEGGLAPPP